MKVAGAYVGLGEGIPPELPDSSDEIARIKAWLKPRFTPARNTLDDGPVFTPALTAEVKRIQAIRVGEGKLKPGEFIPGVINLATKYALGYLKPPVNNKRPIIFTVEGHMSSMWIGPCAFIGAQMEAEGLAWHQPISYDRTSLPFKNATGVNEVLRFYGQTTLDNGRPFPADLDHYLLGFSQGSIITNKVWMQHLKNAPAGSLLAARRDHLKRAIAFGDPWREKNVTAGWWPDEPEPGTQGISDQRMVDTPPFWKSANRKGDLYTNNPDNEVGLNRTAIYKIAAENSWSGGPAGLLQRMMDFLTPADDILPIFQAIIGGVMFLGNMDSHGGYNLDAPTDYIRQGLLGR